MQLTVYRGCHEIGGNCVELSAGSTRIILDLGMSLPSLGGQPARHTSSRRPSPGELVSRGVAPAVPGLFTDGAAVDAVFVSHGHGDHSGLLPYVPRHIPIYATSGSVAMMRAGRLFARQACPPRARRRELPLGQAVTIGPFTVTAFPVDHSTYGSVALLIEADGKRVLYSGDLRLHGRKPGMARRLHRALAGKTIDALVMEGTLAGAPHRPRVTEAELENDLVDSIRSAPGLVLASFSPQHVDRLVGFIRAAKRTGRVFVADVYAAYVIDLLRAEGVPVPPPVAASRIRVFYPHSLTQKRQTDWLREVCGRYTAGQIAIDEIAREPKKYLMVFRPSLLGSDFKNTLPEGTRCLYSRWAGYLQGDDWRATTAALTAAGGDLVHLHTSGHLLPGDFAAFLKPLDIKRLIPIHTTAPEAFQAIHERVYLAKDGEEVEV